MSSFPANLAPLVRRRLVRFVSQSHVQLNYSLAISVREIAQIIRENRTSGRYARFRKNDKSRARLTPTLYIDRVIATWVEEAPNWKRLIQHDNATWKQLCERYTRAGEKWIGRGRSLRGFTAEDFAQQAMELMLKAEYPFDVPFEPWALTILHRVIYGRARADKDVMDHQPESFEELLILADSGGRGIEKQFADPLAHKFVQMAQDHELLWGALEQLQPTLRIVIELFFFEQLTDEEIARKLNTSTTNIQTRRHRGLKRLNSILLGKPLSEKRRRQH